MNPEKLYSHIAQQWQEAVLPNLCDYIKIPNKSPHFDTKWQEHGFIEQAVTHVTKWCEQHAPVGLRLEIIRLPGRTPLLFMEVPGDSNDTILLYGHLDKQPELDGWLEPFSPWQPVLRAGRLYGRGSADDGYAVYASITALLALQQSQLPHARCVLIFESCEESGSPDLPFYMDLLAEKIGAPSLVICLDSGAGNYEQLWLTTSLRGLVSAELSVELLKDGIHSGYSGMVADSFRVARQLINRIEDADNGAIKLAPLHCAIPVSIQHQVKDCAAILGASVYNDLPLQSKVAPVTPNIEELILNRTWRPALSITGAAGLPPIADAGNVLRAHTALKLSMRLPPLVDATLAATTMQEALTKTPPYQAKVELNISDKATGWQAPLLAPWLERAVREASLMFYQKPAAYMGEGGTIPFMGMLGRKFPNAQFVVTGVLGPHANAHGPNEFLDLEMAQKLTACVAFILHAQYLP